MEPSFLSRLRDAAAAVFSGSSVLVAYAHGSRVSGRPRPSSDLDVGYYVTGHRRGDRLSILEEMGLASALSDAIGIEVDLRDLGTAPLDVKGRVLEDGIRIYSADDVERVGLERDLLGRYHDYKETFLRMHEERLRNLPARFS